LLGQHPGRAVNALYLRKDLFMHTLTAHQDALVAEFSSLIEGKPQPHRQDVFARLRKDLPIFRSDRLDAWVVTRYDDVKTVLSRDDKSSRRKLVRVRRRLAGPSCRWAGASTARKSASSGVKSARSAPCASA